MTPITASIIYTVLTGVVCLFQLALAAGLPWGAASMGGKFPGKYPPKMRGVALVNMAVLILLALIVGSRAGLWLPAWSGFAGGAIWLVVVFSALGTVMNTITPSKIERIWAPVVLVQFITSLIVAIN